MNARQRRTGRRLARTVCKGWNGEVGVVAFERACRKHRVDLYHLHEQWLQYRVVHITIDRFDVGGSAMLYNQEVYGDYVELVRAFPVAAGADIAIGFHVYATPVFRVFMVVVHTTDGLLVSTSAPFGVDRDTVYLQAPRDTMITQISYATEPVELVTVALWLDTKHPIARKHR